MHQLATTRAYLAATIGLLFLTTVPLDAKEASKCQVELLVVMDMSGTQNFNRSAMQCSQDKVRLRSLAVKTAFRKFDP